MAKRRLWDSASRLPSGLLFVLLLGSISIINCASYNSLEHRYRDDDSAANLDSLIGQWAPSGPLARVGLKPLSSSAAAPIPAPQLLVEQPVVSYYEQQQQRPSSTLAEDRQRFYNQLESLENNYYDNSNNNRDSELLRSYSDSHSISSNSPQDQYQVENNQPSDLESDIETQRKLLDLLSLSSEGQKQLADYADQQSSSSYEFDNPTKHHLLPSSSYQIIDEADQGNSVDSAAKLNDFANSPTEASTPSPEKRSGSQQQEEQLQPQAKANSTLTTTLVDEDENENDLVAKAAASKAPKTDEEEGDVKTSSAPQVSYGKVVTGDDNDKGSLSKLSSLLGGLYEIVASHWPAALKSSSARTIAQPALNETSPQVSEEEEVTTEGPTKLSVSEPDSVDASETSKDNTEEDEEKHDKEPELEQVKQTIRIKPKKATNEQQQQQREDKSSGRNRISLLRQSTNMLMPFKSNDELIVESDDQPTGGGNLLGKYIYAPEHHYHLSTASSFASSSSSDQKRLVTAADAYSDDSDSDDRQMFANHRGSGVGSGGSRNIHAGDDVFSAASAFNQLRPAAQAFYAAQHLGVADGGASDRFSLVPNNKSNDLYFLVMVAAFCAMAMAVVLAAGLFAYRVQQNRKSSSEQDYPTYGVVGPNNMNINGANGVNGKCGGAASFVGGYFTSSSGSSSTVGSNKSGSVKQLADMYSIGADSGISTGGKCASAAAGGKRVVLANDQVGVAGQPGAGNQVNGGSRFANQNAARMYHYQHQKQQMIISDRSSTNGRQTSASDLDSEEENDENSYTVYECPGLASAHEMEIKNPLFNDDQTP